MHHTTLTGEGVIIGTARAMSPEQALGRQVDHRSDLLPLGVLLYEISSGSPPWAGRSPLETLTLLCNTQQEPLHEIVPGASQDFSSLVDHLLEKDPDLRPSNAHQVVEAIDRLLQGDSFELPLTGSGQRRSSSFYRQLRTDRSRAHSGSSQQAISADTRMLPDEGGRYDTHAAGPTTLVGAPRPSGEQPHPRSSLGRVGDWLRRHKAVAAFLLVPLGILLALIVERTLGNSESSKRSGARHSLVVLPSIVHGDPSDLFLTDAIANTISMNLAQVAGLQTKLPPSSEEYDRTGRDLKTITDAYGASVALLPTVSVDEARLRLNLQLVDAGTRDVLWAGDLEGDRGRFLELSRSAAEEVRKVLSPTTPSLPRVSGFASDSETELALNRGVFLSSRYRRQGAPQDFDAALQALEKAAASSPERAEIPIEMARLYAARVATGEAPENVLPKLRSLAHQALELDRDRGRAWAVLSEAEQLDPEGSYRVMLEHALKAVTHAPEDPYAHQRLRHALAQRSVLLGLRASKEVTRLEPLAVSTFLADAIVMSTISRLDEARELVDRALAIEPDMPFAILVHALLDIVAGDSEAVAARIVDLEPMVEQGRLRPDWLRLVEDYAALQSTQSPRGQEAREAVDRLLFLARGGARFPRWDTATSQVAPLVARSGDTRGALELLQQRQELGVLQNYDSLLLNPDLAPIRVLPEFEELSVPAIDAFREMLDILAAARLEGEYPEYLDPALEHLLPLVGIERPW